MFKLTFLYQFLLFLLFFCNFNLVRASLLFYYSIGNIFFNFFSSAGILIILLQKDIRLYTIRVALNNTRAYTRPQ
jgi:hypothetical protein